MVDTSPESWIVMRKPVYSSLFAKDFPLSTNFSSKNCFQHVIRVLIEVSTRCPTRNCEPQTSQRKVISLDNSFSVFHVLYRPESYFSLSVSLIGDVHLFGSSVIQVHPTVC